MVPPDWPERNRSSPHDAPRDAQSTEDFEDAYEVRDANTAERTVYDDPQNKPKYENEFKARRTGPKSFTGEFVNFPNWKWVSYVPLQNNVWHPANIWLNRPTRVPRPKGPYRVDPGKDTEGGKYSKRWRDYITLEKDKEKREIAKNGRPTDRTVPRNGKTDENWAKAVIEKRYWGTDWRDLYLLRNTPKTANGWQEHHINPANWGGDDDVQNMIFITQEDHHPITTWFEKTRDQILAQLDKEEESRQS